jgi:mono/diheme cytochrome c family protein
MEFTLSGELYLQEDAEAYLERAFALRQDDEELNRILGRFYNMRAVEHDFSKAEMQERVYGALLGEQDPEEMSVPHFVSHSFFMLAKIMGAADEGRMGRALGLLRDLERQLEMKSRQHPDDIELHALAGNFELFFAGYLPTRRRARVRSAAAHFEVVRERWDELRPGAKDPGHCPNTRENFMFELAEARLMLGEAERAATIYSELITPSQPVTRGKELVAHVSADRLAHLDEYEGRKELMPPWPSDVGNCVVCHSWTGELSARSLYSIGPIDFSTVPTAAAEKPVADALRSVPAEIEGIPTGVTEVLARRCSPCHFEGGRAQSTLDLGDPKTIEAEIRWIEKVVDEGSMPPDDPLDAADRAMLEGWMQSLRGDAQATGGD